MPDNFIYKNVKVPGSDELIYEINAAAISIHKSLSQIDLKSARISEYNQKYLKTKLEDPHYNWSINIYMLSWLLSKTEVPRENLVFVDYGGGSGTVSFLAKKLGIGTVVYCDIFDVSCRDARSIGGMISCEADYYITGEIFDLIKFLRREGLSCDIFASHDCIEHVYNIEKFLKNIQNVSNGPLTVWLSSAANGLRPKTARTLSKVHMQSEYEDRKPEFGAKERDTLRSFLDIRREIIRNETGNLSLEEVEELAIKTRGLREDDLRKAVRNYIELGKFPPKVNHPTNTCDPYTGNWAERLMNPYDLQTIMEEDGFVVKVMPGYWSLDRSSKLKQLIKSVMNIIISSLGRRGLKFAPYFVLGGTLCEIDR